VRLALKYVMQNDRNFMAVIHLYVKFNTLPVLVFVAEQNADCAR